MKITLFSIFVALLAMFAVVPSTLAQDDTTLGLPEAAKARLGRGKINEVKYSPDGTRLAVASIIGIWIYDAQTGEALELISGHTSVVNSVSFNSDGTILASGGQDRIVRLWDVSTGSELRTLTGHTSVVNSVSFSPDGTILASGGQDRTVRLWDTNTGSELRTLTGHTRSVRNLVRSGVISVSFSPNGKMIASGGADNTIRLWDANTGHLRPSPDIRIGSSPFSPDGT